jgi:hypothetical protein
MAKTPTRKRPCRICRRWFLPDPRLKQRQKTCGQAKCQRQWHKKKCSQWNRKNRDYFKANYLQRKIDTATQPRGDPAAALPKTVPPSRMNTGMPLEYVKEVLGVELVIIQEYLAQLLDQRWRPTMHMHQPSNTGTDQQTTGKIILRGDKSLMGCNH